MSERTIIAVVSDLIRSGLTVEQQILVNELVIVAGDLQAKASYHAGWDAGAEDAEAARRAHDAERMRRVRNVQNVQNTGTIPPIPPRDINNKKITPQPPLDADFETWWALYPRREAKRGALKAYRNARNRASADEILAGLRRYVTQCKGRESQFIKMPATWLNSDCWLDETKVVDFTPSTPKQTFRPEPPKLDNETWKKLRSRSP